MFFSFFFFNDTATTEIYTLSLHDALPICGAWPAQGYARREDTMMPPTMSAKADRKSTRLNSSHANISYAVFCLKKKKNHVEKQSSTRDGLNNGQQRDQGLICAEGNDRR